MPRTKKNKCKICGAPVVNDFCSRTCVIEQQWRDKKLLIIKTHGVGCDIRQLKKYLIEKDGHKCSICGGTEWQGQPIPLIIDHIDGRASNNNLDNLRIVCANCDCQLPTFKSKNKNSDRKRTGKYI